MSVLYDDGSSVADRWGAESRGITTYSRNGKRWQGGSMVVRWVGAAIVEAEKKFRRVQGWRDIEKLVRALRMFDTEQEATAECVAQK